jgi:hypothetical protein
MTAYVLEMLISSNTRNIAVVAAFALPLLHYCMYPLEDGTRLGHRMKGGVLSEIWVSS